MEEEIKSLREQTAKVRSETAELRRGVEQLKRELRTTTIPELLCLYHMKFPPIKVETTLPVTTTGNANPGSIFRACCENNWQTIGGMSLTANPFGSMDLVVPCLKSRSPLMDIPSLQKESCFMMCPTYGKRPKSTATSAIFKEYIFQSA